jgi:hypothetical protein
MADLTLTLDPTEIRVAEYMIDLTRRENDKGTGLHPMYRAAIDSIERKIVAAINAEHDAHHLQKVVALNHHEVCKLGDRLDAIEAILSAPAKS